MKILILPYSKYKNPYQKILIGELCQLGHKVYHGSHEVIFPIIKNYKRYKPNYIIIDWYHQWYLKEKLIITIIRLYTMLVDYIIVSKYYKIPIIQNMHNIEHHNNKKYISIQRMALKYILKIVSDIRFFTQGQKNKVLSLNFVVEKKKIYGW